MSAHSLSAAAVENFDAASSQQQQQHQPLQANE